MTSPDSPSPEPSSRGVLRPDRLPQFDRVPATGRAAQWVRWFWISQWNLPDGAESAQDVIGFPALNIVVEPMTVSVSGATTRLSTRVLTGSGWAVGGLMRPAAVDWLAVEPATLVDEVVTRRLDVVSDPVRTIMRESRDPVAAAAAFSDALCSDAPVPGPDAVLADRIVTLIEGDATIVTVEQVGAAVGVSARTVQRLTLRYTGLTPLTLIRRRRLHEAAERVRNDQSSLAEIAADTGFTDHAHLTREFSRVLGFTPSAYRADASKD
ncbi:helix-turn-helix transcriptional regulator [Gordonia sp. PDNC005]|uniref:helix-turn-helix transcriptional regulator n=1 Tax=unclassified Gordonia (in: high G+C Gram-positive bacteria) TaxID=2657482 RepID=UPI00196585BA|nr:helix-turn-helix transcriptional regulator [Gordonia sp. PDNC005]QRY60882.1 helix-turn-helix transcriptional regulator [Gordonia sp. PDNC005]